MGLDILAPVHIKKVKETGTIGVIDVNDWDNDVHYFVNPDFWGMVDTEHWVPLTGGGAGVKDRTGVFVGDSYYAYCGADGNDNHTGELVMYRVDNPTTGAGHWHGLATGLATKESCLRTDGTNLWAYGGYVNNSLRAYIISDNVTGTGSWWTVPNGAQPIPIPTTQFDTCIYNGYLYVYGGNNGEPVSTSYNQFWRFPLTATNTDGWEQLASGTYPCHGHVIGAWNNKIYVFGGLSTVAKPPNTQIYDIATNSWTIGSFCPFVATESEGYVYQDRFYIHTPTYINGLPYSSIWVYDFVNDYWSKRIGGGRLHSECSAACHYATGNMYVYGTSYDNILDMWKYNDISLAIRKVS